MKNIVIWVAILGFIGLLLYGAIIVLIEEHRNDRAPKQTCAAGVIGRRLERYRGKYSRSESHYVVFRLDQGALRREFCVEEEEYDRLEEGIHGKLTFQGTRYLGFEQDDV